LELDANELGNMMIAVWGAKISGKKASNLPMKPIKQRNSSDFMTKKMENKF
jgi:hypothetical protein